MTLSTACPKPAPSVKGPRKAPKRSGPLPRSTKKIAKVNPERLAKRRASYAKKLGAYRRSDTRKLVEVRSGGRCERTIDRVDIGFGICEVRCPNPAKVHNHKTYARFGGQELPNDIEHLCKSCNEKYEAQHTTRNRNYRRAS